MMIAHDFIDVLEESGTAPRKYCRCLYTYNKIDMLSIQQVDDLARQPNTCVISVRNKLNLDGLLDIVAGARPCPSLYKEEGLVPRFYRPHDHHSAER